MATNTSARLGYKFGYDHLADGWSAYINGGDYSSKQEDALVTALVNAQVAEFDALLPDGYSLMAHTSELYYPAGDDTELDDLDELMEQASEAVTARYNAIETEALADLD